MELTTEQMIEALRRPKGKDIFTDLYERIDALEKEVAGLKEIIAAIATQ